MRLGKLLLGTSMIAAFGLGLVLAAAVVPGGGAAGSSDPATADFRLPSLEGPVLGPADFSGQVVVVDFWASWCAPCHVQSEIIDGLHDEWSDRGVQFLAVNLGEDEELVRRFVGDHPVPYPVLLDPEDRLTRELQILALPTVMVVDTGGRVVYDEAGIVQGPELEELMVRAGA